jgi:hypothetical protein
MFPLARQVQIACDVAQGCAGRLAGMDLPKYDDNEVTFEELQARENAVAFYERNGFHVVKPSFLLFNEIQHFLMEKMLG